MERTESKVSGHLRIVAALSLAALAIAGAIKFSSRPEVLPPLAKARPTMEDLASRNYIPETDTDGDGVPDWQELLDGTDPRDPKSFATASSTPKSGLADASTLTQTLSNQMLDELHKLQQSNTYSDERAATIGQTLTNNIPITTPFTPYTESNLAIRYDNSADAVAAHRLAVQTALKPLLSMTMPELTVYGAYLEDHDQSHLADLSQRAGEYRTAAKALAKIPVPSDLANTDLATINALAFYASVLDRMVAQVNDPVAALALLTVFNRSEAFVETTLNNLTDYYRAKLATT